MRFPNARPGAGGGVDPLTLTGGTSLLIAAITAITALRRGLFAVFPAYQRARLYQMLGGWLEDRMNLQQALFATAGMFDIAGTGAERRRAQACREMADALPLDRFEHVAARYLPREEIALIGTGREFGYALPIGQLEEMCALGERLARQARGNILAPLALSGLVIALLGGSASLIDLFAQSRADLPVPARIYQISGHFIGDHVLLIALTLAGLWLALLWALPNYTGPGRVALDRIMPFSFYRMRAGAGFLFLLRLLARAGRHLDRARAAPFVAVNSPYLRDRVEKITSRIGALTPGAAMAQAGTGFPDPEFVALMVMIEQRGRHDPQGHAALIETALTRWMARMEEKAARSMMHFRLAVMVLVTGFLASFFVIFYQLWRSGGIGPGGPGSLNF